MTLRITAEIVPFGIERNKRTIETIQISNYGYVMRDAEDCAEDDMCIYHITTSSNQHASVNHYRSDGYRVLLEKVLKELKSKYGKSF